MRAGKPQKRKKIAGKRKGKPKENWKGPIQRIRRDRKEKNREEEEEQGREGRRDRGRKGEREAGLK